MIDQVKSCEFTDEEIYEKFEEALVKLYKNDYDVLVNNAHERSIAARIAMYLRDLFEKCNEKIKVDVEYNRDVNIPKRLQFYTRKNYKDKTSKHAVYPDIIVHMRGTKEYDLLCCEMKKDEENDFDKTKILGYVEEYKYRIGVHIYKINDTGVNLNLYDKKLTAINKIYNKEDLLKMEHKV